MKSLAVVFVLVALMVCASANPIMIKVVNEFQVAPETSERIEFKLFRIPAPDTFFDPVDLYGISVKTPVSIAVIDTHLILPGNGFVVIDSTFLSGSFDLPDSASYILVTQGWRDSVSYPYPAPTPPSGSTAALFYGYSYYPMDGYYMFGDWYIDVTPTLGAVNDDYPGCIINGHVYDASAQPIYGAEIVVNAGDNVLPHPPSYKCCTTYTAVDGSYAIDSLQPYCYWVKVAGSSYYPDSHYTNPLRCLTPTTVNFYLTGTTEATPDGAIAALTVAPNPFRRATRISAGIRDESAKLRGGLGLRIYDAKGSLVRCFKLPTTYSLLPTVVWDGTDQNGCTVPMGVYFAQLDTVEGMRITKIIKTR